MTNLDDIKIDALITVRKQFDNLDLLGKKTILNHLGISKENIEKIKATESLSVDELMMQRFTDEYKIYLDDVGETTTTVSDIFYNCNIYLSDNKNKTFMNLKSNYEN